MFAAPFVLVMGCSQPSERPTTPTQSKSHDAGAARNEDTASGEIADAAQPECVPGFGRTCNPPAPDARSLIVREGTVTHVEKRADGLYFDVSFGPGPTVDWKWVTEFVDDSGKPIEGTRFKITERTGSMIVGFLANRSELPSKRVRVSEPGER